MSNSESINLVGLIDRLTSGDTNMGFFDKIAHAGHAQANKAANAALDADPMAVVQLEIDQATEEIQKAQPDLAELKGHVNRLTSQSMAEASDIAALNAKIDLLVKSGNDAAAGQLDAQLQTKEKEHAATGEQLSRFMASYNKIVGNVKTARQRITDAQASAQQKGMELKLSEANKHASEISINLSHFTSDHLSTLGHATDLLQARIDANNASAEVQSDLGIGADPNAGTGGIDLDAAVAAAATTDRLAKRKAAMGLNTPTSTTVTAPSVTVTVTPAPAAAGA